MSFFSRIARWRRSLAGPLVPARRTAPAPRDPALAESVEPRILYSADAIAGLLPAASSLVGPDSVMPADAPTAQASMVAPAEAIIVAARATELVFVDPGVPDAQRLVDAIAARRPDAAFHIIELDPTRDGLAQITEALAGEREVAAIHIVSHGDPGAIELNGRRIDAAALETEADQFTAWRAALGDQADLLIYGCDVAATPAGVAMLMRLAELTGADVAGSTDPTGSTDAGGDWTLEASIGAIQAGSLFADGDPLGWNGLLPEPVVFGPGMAPALNPNASPAMPSILEGATDPSGITVASLVVDGSIIDADGGALEAIAITALDTSLGTWQYSTDDGTNWLTIDAAKINNTTNELALLLGPTASIRMLPFGDLNGTLSSAITFRAWDMTSGATGDYTVIANPGTGASAFSAASDTASLTVTAVNDAPTFAPVAGSGKLIVPVGSSDDFGRSVVVQPDGKILMAGYSSNGSDFDYSLIRLSADGSLDTSFDGDGKLILPVGSSLDYGQSITVQADGKILVAGYSLNSGTYDFSLIRLNADGSTDSAFGSGGKLVVPVGSSNDVSYNLVVQPDGKILIAGASYNGIDLDFSLIRVNANGSLDTSFDGDGKLIVPIGSSNDVASSLTVQPDGKILVAGTSSGTNSDFSVIRLNADGVLDSAFGTGGKLIVPVGSGDDAAYSLTLQPDGKILVAGYAFNGSNNDFSLIRLTADGVLDGSFGSAGTLLIPLGSGQDETRSLMLQPDGKILVAGFSFNGSDTDFSVVRLNADGSLDTSFDGDGKLTVPVGSGEDSGRSLSLQPDGKILLAGYSSNGIDQDFSLIRINADGSLDTTFNGSATNTLGGSVSYTAGAAAVALDAGVAIYDVDLAALNSGAGDYSGASITLARDGGANAEDVFSTLGNLSFTGGNALLSGVTVGTVSNAAGTLSITFNSNATQARVNELLSSLAYANSSGTPPASVQIQWTFSDGNTSSQGSGGALTAQGTSTVNITTTNVPPVLNAAASPAMPTILENAANPSGISVASLVVDGSIADADGSATEAIAITALDTSLGTWQYSTDNGVNWLTIDAAEINNTTNELALLLGPTASIRMLPFGDLNGTLNSAITFRAWDMTSGATGDYTVITNPGTGTSAFSSASDTASLTVTAVNDAPTFAPVAGSGKLIVPVGSSDDFGRSVVVQPDGKILVAGYSSNGIDDDFSVIRLNADGSLDTFFDGDGKVIVPIGNGLDRSDSITIQPDGKILVAGYSFNGTDDDFSLIRLNSDGSLDTSFDGDGKLIVPVGSGLDQATSLTVQPDGKILVVGSSSNGTDNDFSVIRLNANGSFDNTFGSNGKLLVAVGSGDDGGTSLTVQPDGKILVAGYSFNGVDDDSSLIRLNADGSLDASFNGDGKLIVPMDSGDDALLAMTLQSDGKILVSGYATVGGAAAVSVIRLNSNGSLDTSFDTDGKVTMSVGSGFSYGASLTVQADGKILIAGVSITLPQVTFDVSLIRLNADGSLDTTFDSDGKLIVPVGSNNDFVNSLALQPDGKILVAGSSFNGSDYDSSLIRVNADGSFDTTFNGSATNTLGGSVSYTEGAGAVALDAGVAIYDADLAALNNGAGDYSGASITLVRNGGANAEDVFSALGNLSFASGNAVLSGVTIGTVSNAAGTLSITFNINATQARVNELLSSLAYVNSSDSPPASVQIVWTFSDGNTSAQGSGVALTAQGTTTVNITAVNDGPSGTSTTLTTLEDTPRALAAADFGFADANDSPANAFYAVSISTLPTAGSLTLNGTAVTAGQSISVADINADKLVFTPGLNANGNSYASFTFQVQDDGGTADGGVDLDPTAKTITFNVTPVNDAPVLDTAASPELPTILENATNPSGITVASLVVDGSITDADGSAVEAIAITALDTSLGTWQYSTDGGINWLTIDAQKINSQTNELALLLGPTAQLRLLPFGDLNGALASAVTFRAWDQTAGSEGQYVVITATGDTTAFSSATDTASITVTPVNDAPTFAPVAGSGKLIVPVGSGDDYGLSLSLQPDGKILVAGYSFNGTDQDFSLIRLNADGSLDTTFDGDGKLLVPVGSSTDVGYSVTLQPDGKILVAGYSFNGTDQDFSLIRLNADGSLDATFDGDGKLIVPVGSSTDIGRSVTVQPDGKILAAGYSTNGINNDFSLIRLNGDGSLDTTFDVDGKLIVPVDSGNDYSYSLSVQPDGKILVAGYSSNGTNNDFSLIRLNVDGSLDTSFDGDGKLLMPVGSGDDIGRSLSLQPDGKILVAGYSSNGGNDDFSLIRLNADGSLDTSFDGDGTRIVPVGSGNDYGYSLSLQPDGKILVAGTSSNGGNDDFSLIRLNADGSLDTTFDSDGKLMVPVGSGTDDGYSLSLQPDGKILVAGYSVNGSLSNFSLIRVNTDGSLDTTFNGAATNTLGGSVSYTEGAVAVALDAAVAIYDADLAALNNGTGDYSGASITLARDGGANAQDVFSTLGNLSFTSGNAVLSGVTIGTVSNTASTLSITFNSNATQSRVDELISSLAYANSSDAPPASVQIVWTFSDGNTSVQGSGGALTAQGTSTVTVTLLNDSPVLNAAASPSLPKILEGATNPAGITVASLVVDGSITDADGSATEAIAITALDTSLGTWQYSTDGGANWLTIDAAKINSTTNELALLLGPTASIRMLPFGDLNGTLSTAITFRAWDMSSGATGDYTVITNPGTSGSAFSAASDAASLTVTAVNDAPTFARVPGTGKLIVPVGSGSDFGNSLTIQPDGKILVAGLSSNGSDYDFSLVRLNADGSLDTSFDGDGRLIVPVGSTNDYGYSLSLQPDGKILLAGTSFNSGNQDFSLIRLNVDGSLDTSFNGSGKLVVPVGSGSDYGQSVTLQSDGKILVSGWSYNGTNDDFSLIRLNADGSLDTSFDGDGKLIVPVGSSTDIGYSLTVQPDGNILLAGWSYNGTNDDFSLIRLNGDGSLDTSFDGDGKLIVPVGASNDAGHSVTVQPGGKIIVVGASYNGSNQDFSLIRLNADGSLDTTFDGDGKLIMQVGSADDVAASVTVQPDGKIVVAGTSANGITEGFSLVRLNADGSLDTSFGTAGKLIVPVGDSDPMAVSVALQPDGKITIAGNSINGSTNNFSLIRVNADGSLDTTFGSIAANTLGGSVSYTEGAAAVVLDAGVAIYDADLAALNNGVGDYSGASITLARDGGANAEDVFSTLGNLSFTGGNAMLSGVSIGTVSNAAGTLSIIFNSNATQARVDELLSSLAYANTSDAPPSSVQIVWTFSDGNTSAQGSGGALTTQGTSTVNITAVNEAPSGASTTLTTLEDTPRALAAADFGFADANDSPANALLAVSIATLPTAGSLTLDGTAVTAGQSISVTDINAGKLVFTPVSNANGNSYASFTFQVQDDGGTADGGVNLDPTAKTITFNVLAVNDAPSGADKTLTTNENTPWVFAATDFGFTDASDTPANALMAVTMSSLPIAGSLTLAGTAVTVGQSISVADINAGRLVFTPVTNANGTAYSSFTFRVQDNGGTANGGVDLDPTAKTITFDVIAVNDAPSGADKTLTTNEGAPWVFAAADFGFSDASDSPANALMAITMSSLPTAGSFTLAGTAVSAGQSISIADINAGKLVFTPVTNANGNSYASFTFRVQDNGGTANGGVDLDATAKTITFNVIAVNDAPSGADKTLTTNEGAPWVFAATDFGFTDASDSPTNALMAVTMSSLPIAGSLTLAGASVTVGQSISVADINAGRLVFTPVTNANGTAYSSFTFRVQDNGGTANGGVDLDPTAKTITFDVIAVNDAPSGADKTLITNEGTPWVFAATDFGFSDANDTPANALSAVTISSLATAGSLTLSGTAVTVGQSISVADINAGRLVFTPVTNGSGNGYASFTFRVQDNGGTANGGVDLDATAKTITFNVIAVNDAPSGADKTLTTNEGAPWVFAATDFGFTDTNDTPSNALIAVTMSSLPTAGSLTLAGTAVTVGQSISVADINAGRLVFTPVTNANGNSYASFTFRVQDNGGVANGGVDLDPTAKTITFNVTPVNDAPAGTSTTLTTNEGAPWVFAAADFGFTDANDSPANAMMAITMSSLPTAGSLTLAGIAVTAGQSISIADINAGRLVFTSAANASGPGYASFTFRVQDNGGTANGGVDLDPTAKSITFNVIAVNDAPSGADKTLTTNEDTAWVFAATDFGFTDANDSPANALMAVTMSSLPAAGSLTLAGTAVTVGQSISVADINAGRLVFTSAANASGTGYASFTFRVQDNGVTTNGGVDLDLTAKTITFNVTAVNDAPAGTSTTLTTNEGTPWVFAAADFGFTDASDSPANALMAITMSSLPTAGSFTLAGTAVSAGQSISIADINAGKLVFTPVTNGSGNGYASFTFRVQDNGGTTNGGVDLDVTAKTITFNVIAVNDAPSGADKTLTTNEDTPWVFAAVDFGCTDASDSPANALMAVTMSSLPIAGSLTLAGTAVAVGQSISIADINAGKLVFTPVTNGSGNGYASFTFRVQDNGGTTNGGVDLDVTAKTITFNVIAVNDAPSGADKTLTTNEGAPWVFAATDFGFTDASDSPSNALMAITMSSLPTTGSLTLAGIAVTAGQSISIADISAGRLVFTPVTNANGTAYSSFTFRVQDNGGTANGGVDLDPTAKTISFNVTPVNNAPVITSSGGGANASLSVSENSTSVTQVTATDIDLPAQRLAYSIVGGADAARFEIDANTGLLSFVSAPRWHLPADANGDNRYEVIVGAGDGSLLTTQALAITVTNLPDAPVVTAPPSATLLENTGVPIAGLGVSDVDGNLSTVNLRVQHGSLTLDLAGGAIIVAGEQGSSTITLGGNASQLQAALASLSYRSVPDFHGSDTLQVLATDATGLQAGASTAITVTPINHLPELNAPGAQATLAGMPLEFRAQGNNPIFISDVDDIEATLRVTLTVRGGSLLITSVDGLTLAPHLGAGADSTLIIEGPMGTINAALATLSFLPDDDFFGETSLDLIVRDLTDPASGVDLSRSVPIEVSLPPTVAPTPVTPMPVSVPPVGTTPVASTPVGTTPVGSAPVGTTTVVTPAVGSTTIPAAATASMTDASSGKSSAKAVAASATAILSSEEVLAPLVPGLISAAGTDRPDIAIRLTAPVEMALVAPIDISASRRLESSTTVSTVVRALESQALSAGVFVVTPDSVSVIGLADDTRNSIGARSDETQSKLRVEDLESTQTVGDELTLSSLSVQSTAIAVSAGVLWWLVNGGTLLWIVLTYGPLARTFDPLPILARERRDDEEDDGLPDLQDPLDVPTLFDDHNAPSPAHRPVPDDISRETAAIVESA